MSIATNGRVATTYTVEYLSSYAWIHRWKTEEFNDYFSARNLCTIAREAFLTDSNGKQTHYINGIAQ